MIVTFVCPSAPTPTGGVTALYEFANGLARRGHVVHIVHGPFWGRRIDSMADLAWFDFEPAVHHHVVEDTRDPRLPEADILFGTEGPRRMGLPVLIIQGLDMFPKEMERRVFRTPCLKICVASWLVDVGARFGVPPEQLVYVPMGIDHGLFRVTRALDDRPATVGMLYNPHPAKGWHAGRLALERAHEAIPTMRAVVFGTEAPSRSLPEWMDFVEAPSGERLRDEVYNRCSVFLQASRWEGFGFTAVEAMACGCALVTTDNGGSRDYALDGVTARTAAPGDLEGLGRHLVALLEDPAQRVSLAHAGLAHVARFDWDLAAEQMEGHLERYLGDPEAFMEPPADEPTGIRDRGA